MCVNHLVAVQLNKGKCGVNSIVEHPSYIVGGSNTDGPGVWPWICSAGFLSGDKWEHRCGAVLVTFKHALTAAHCSKTGEILQIRCGDYHLSNSSDDKMVQLGDVIDFAKHDKYNPALINYDVSVLYLESELQNTSFVQPICLTQVEMPNTAVTVLGWGLDENRVHSMELKKTVQQILSPQRCERALGPALWRHGGFGADLFCAADPTRTVTGSCSGDSGGPIFELNSNGTLRYELRGLVNGGKRCGAFNTPDIYTSTTYPEIYKWIRDIIECTDGKQCVPRNECPDVEAKYKIFEAETTNNALKENTRKELRNMVCDQQEKLFCCKGEKKVVTNFYIKNAIKC